MPELDLDAFKSRLTEERSRVAAAIDYLEFENAGSMEDEGEEAGSATIWPKRLAPRSIARSITRSRRTRCTC